MINDQKLEKNLKDIEEELIDKPIKFSSFANYYLSYHLGIQKGLISTPLKDGLILYNLDVHNLSKTNAQKLNIMKNDLKSFLYIVATPNVLEEYYTTVCDDLTKKDSISAKEYLKYVNFLTFVVEANYENIDAFTLFSILIKIHIDTPKKEIETSIIRKCKSTLFNLSKMLYPKEEKPKERKRVNVPLLARQ